MEKAKQLCRLDGMLWSNLDFQNPTAQQTRTTAQLAGEAAQWKYLERAQTLLDTEARREKFWALYQARSEHSTTI